jgi:hypothetical protein
VEISRQFITSHPQVKAAPSPREISLGSFSGQRKSLGYWELVFLRSVAHLKFQGFVIRRQELREQKSDGFVD